MTFVADVKIQLNEKKNSCTNIFRVNMRNEFCMTIENSRVTVCFSATIKYKTGLIKKKLPDLCKYFPLNL